MILKFTNSSEPCQETDDLGATTRGFVPWHRLEELAAFKFLDIKQLPGEYTGGGHVGKLYG